MYGPFTNSYDTKDGFEEVNWTWHVAPIVKLRVYDEHEKKMRDELFILDPLMGSKPLKKDDYHLTLRLGVHSRIRTYTVGTITGYVTCHPDTFDNQADCFNPDRATSLQSFETETRTFLDT